MILSALMPTFLRAQDDPKLTVSSKRQVVVGERFQVVFTANAEGRNFTAPSFEGLTVVGGPFTSSSSSVQVINGNVTRSTSNSYTFAVQAYQEGTFHVGAASLTVDGKKITSEPFDIKVLPDNGASAGASGGYSNGNTGQSRQQQNTNDSQVKGDDLFLRAIPSKKTVYLGEQLVLTYKIYTKLPVSSLSIDKTPSYAGFWTKDITDNNGGALRQSNEYINGEEYTTAEIQKIIIVPQRTGHFTIDPMTLECIAQIRSTNNRRQSFDPFGFFDDPFFGGGYTNVNKSLKSQSLGIEVKPLPETGKPASFAGAVGDYKFSSTIDKTELSTNDAFTLTLTVSGTGNIELLQLPEPNFPPDFEVYDPKVTTTPSTSSQGMSGTKKAEYLVIPRRAGDFTIPPIQFSYFDPSTATYHSAASESYQIHVVKGANTGGGDGAYVSNQEDIQYLGSDVRHIMTGDSHLKSRNAFFFATAPYFVALLALLVLFILMLFILKKHEQRSKDTADNRNRKADKVARGRLKNAYQHLKAKDQDKFYVEMSQALWGYIADKLGIERSKLSMDTVSETMNAKQVPNELTQQFVDTLNSCEFARFAPGSAEEKMDDLYHRGIEVISKAEKVL